MRRWITPRVILPLFELVSGRRFWSELARQRELQWYPAAELESRTLGRIRQLVRHAATHVPFYRALYQQSGIEPGTLRHPEDLGSLPVVSKRALRERPKHEVTAENLPQRRQVRCSTSGSTGAPFDFWLDGTAADRHLGGFLLGLEWAGVALWDLRVDLAVQPGLSWSSRLSSSNPLALGLRRWLLGQDVRQVGHLKITASELCEQLATVPVHRDYCLRVYPSQAGQLAREMVELDLELSHYPRVVITSAETLTAVNEAAISQAFRCPIVDHYSCWEALHLAQSCPDQPGLFHVNSELAHLRVIREDGSPAAPGETGRILLTSLTNEVMPFINYELGDRGALGGLCSCGRGFPTLVKLEGRSDEVVLGRNGGFLSPIVLNQLSVLGKAGEYLQEFQLVETTTGGLVVRIVPTDRFADVHAEAIRNELRGILADEREIVVETVPDIPREESGKRLVIKRFHTAGDRDV